MLEAPGSHSAVVLRFHCMLSHKGDQHAVGWHVCMLGLHVGMHAARGHLGHAQVHTCSVSRPMLSRLALMMPTPLLSR